MLRQLVIFEYSRYRSILPGLNSRESLKITLIYLLVFLGGAAYTFRGHDSPEVLFPAGVVLIFGLMMVISLFHIISLWGQPVREWYLSFPHSRQLLARAKALSLILAGLRMIAFIVAASVIFYTVSASLGGMKWISAGELTSIVGASSLLAIVSLPLAVILGLTISTMYRGWGRWLLIPYIAATQIPTVLFAIIYTLEFESYRLLSPSYLLLYSLGVVVIGWPLSYALLKCVASTGMTNMADVRLRIKAGADLRPSGKECENSTGKKNAWLTLYLMERGLYTHFGSLKPIRVLIYVALLLIAIAAYFTMGFNSSVYEMFQVLFMPPVVGAVVWAITRDSFDRKSLQWRLGFPYPRIYLVLASVAGTWSVTVKAIVMMGIACWIGAATALMTGRVEPQQLVVYFHWFAYSIALSVTLLTVSLGLTQLSYYLMKFRTLYILLMLPLYMLLMFQSVIANKYLFAPQIESLDYVPGWGNLGTILIFGLPSASVCLILGARHLHLALNIRNAAAEKS